MNSSWRLLNITIENFEGPYDLLLELIGKKKLDISEISLEAVTDKFLEFMRDHKPSSSSIGDFLVAASTLLLIKAKQLVPTLDAEEQEEISLLTERIRIYEQYRNQVNWFYHEWRLGSLLGSYALKPKLKNNYMSGYVHPQLSAPILADVLCHLIERLPKSYISARRVYNRGPSMQDCINIFLKRLKRVKTILFQHSFSSKRFIGISLLAVLEMARAGHVTLEQEKPFGMIQIRRL